MVIPLEYLKTNELADNPNGYPYYISLQSILTNYPLLANDHANLFFIKKKLLQFEKNMALSTGSQENITQYKDQYYTALHTIGLTSIATTNEEKLILAAAQSTYPVIDRYYLDDQIFPHNPLYEWKPEHSRRILHYNMAALYQGIPNRYWRILGAASDAFQLGVFSGFFVNNQTTTLVTQFMTGVPILTALYVLPKYDFAKLGWYYAMVPWNYFRAEHFVDPSYRKLLNIAGIEVFTFKKSEFPSMKIEGSKPLPSFVPKQFALDHVSFINLQSYGMAYLANHIQVVPPQNVQPHEKVIKRYFAHADHHDPAQFTAATNALYQQLMRLSHKHDILNQSTAYRIHFKHPKALQETWIFKA